jgi:hypothetical protein
MMQMLEKMFETHPKPASGAGDAALRCAYECAQCGMVCTTCADACLSEETVAHLSVCIRLNLDCADICTTTGRMIARASHGDVASLRAQLQACRTVCQACRDECRKHGEMGMKHCTVCADCCDACIRACDEMIASLVA